MNNTRKIIHIDMDAFFASVEQRDFPEYQGKPIIVGGSPQSRGVVAACSYEARRFGIHSAMPSSRAYRLCPDAIFVRPRFDAYQKVSTDIHKIFRQYTDKVEPLSLDEAYLDVTETALQKGSATQVAEEIRTVIKDKTMLTASAGVSYNKFLAKIASDINKPDGIYVIKPEAAAAFIENLAVEKFFGIGKVTAGKMKALGINTGLDLKQYSKLELNKMFGKVGAHYYEIVRGNDAREVSNKRERKSIGSETTFPNDLAEINEMMEYLQSLAKRVVIILEKKRLKAKTLTLKVKYFDFQQITRSITVDHEIATTKAIVDLLPVLLDRTEVKTRKVRLLGVTLSNLFKPGDKPVLNTQLDLL